MFVNETCCRRNNPVSISNPLTEMQNRLNSIGKIFDRQKEVLEDIEKRQIETAKVEIDIQKKSKPIFITIFSVAVVVAIFSLYKAWRHYGY